MRNGSGVAPSDRYADGRDGGDGSIAENIISGVLVDTVTTGLRARAPRWASTMEVSQNGPSPFAGSRISREERNHIPFAHVSPHSLVRHSCSAGDKSRSHDEDADGPEQPPAAVPGAELQRRSDIKFSGQTGAVVASGRGLATTLNSKLSNSRRGAALAVMCQSRHKLN